MNTAHALPIRKPQFAYHFRGFCELLESSHSPGFRALDRAAKFKGILATAHTPAATTHRGGKRAGVSDQQ